MQTYCISTLADVIFTELSELMAPWFITQINASTLQSCSSPETFIILLYSVNLQRHHCLRCLSKCPACVILYGRRTLSRVRTSFIHSHLKIRILQGHLFSGAQQDQRSSSLVVWSCEYVMKLREGVGGEEGGCKVAACLQVRAVPLWIQRLHCHNLTDGWAGQNNHSKWDPRPSKVSDLPDHYPLVTSSAWSEPARVSVLPTLKLPESFIFWFGGKRSKSQPLYCRWEGGVVSAIALLSLWSQKLKKSKARQYFSVKSCYLFAAHSTDIHCSGLNSTGGGTCRQIDSHK